MPLWRSLMFPSGMQTERRTESSNAERTRSKRVHSDRRRALLSLLPAPLGQSECQRLGMEGRGQDATGGERTEHWPNGAGDDGPPEGVKLEQDKMHRRCF